jgi:hypothetical protein
VVRFFSWLPGKQILNSPLQTVPDFAQVMICLARNFYTDEALAMGRPEIFKGYGNDS